MRSPGVYRAQMRSPVFTWVEEMQMRSGVVRDEIGGGKWQMPSRYLLVIFFIVTVFYKTCTTPLTRSKKFQNLVHILNYIYMTVDNIIKKILYH